MGQSSLPDPAEPAHPSTLRRGGPAAGLSAPLSSPILGSRLPSRSSHVCGRLCLVSRHHTSPPRMQARRKWDFRLPLLLTVCCNLTGPLHSCNQPTGTGGPGCHASHPYWLSKAALHPWPSQHCCFHFSWHCCGFCCR